MRRLKLETGRRIFLGIKLDGAMRREIEQGSVRQRPAFREGDPAHLELLEVAENLYMGRVLESGVSMDGIEDLKRNVRSIVLMTFPGQKVSGALHLYAVEIEELTSSLAAAG